MQPFQLIAMVVTALVAGAATALAQATEPPVALELAAGRPLQIVLDERTMIRRVGQTVRGTLAEPVYAYDRIVLPAGSRVIGHVDTLEQPSKLSRARAIFSGDFSPHRVIVLRFDTVDVDEAHRLPIETVVVGGGQRVKRQVAGGDKRDDEQTDKPGVVRRARDEIARRKDEIVQRKDDVLGAIKDPGKMDRLKEMAINQLPYHPQFLVKGAMFTAELTSSVDFGTAGAAPEVAADLRPAPNSVLTARLVTALDSSKTPRGTPLEAVVTQPVFSADHRLILPEGTSLTGTVTFAKEARHFHRNGQLRFLIESVHAPAQTAQPLLASLYSVQAGESDHVAIDEEGGAAVTNPKSRFLAPALALLALRGSIRRGERGIDGDADDSLPAPRGSVGGQSVGGFLGFGAIGTVLSLVSRPAAIAFSAVGVARTVYTTVIGKGHEVTFAAGTPVQLRLAPGPSPAQ